MNDERETRECRDCCGCTDEEYRPHRYRYNRALFHNMMGFMDICWEVDVISGKLIVMYDDNYNTAVGSSYDYDEIITKIADSRIYGQDYEFFTWQMSIDSLKKLRQELEFRVHVIGETGLPEAFKVILTPAMDENNNVCCVYMSGKNIEEDVQRVKQMHNEKNAIFAAMSNSYLCIAYADLAHNDCELFVGETVEVQLPKHVRYDALYEYVLDKVIYEYRERFGQSFSLSALIEHFKMSDEPVIMEAEHQYSDGRHWTEIKAAAVKDSMEELIAVITFSIIDERKKNELAGKIRLERINEHLRRSLGIEEQYRQAIVSGAVMVYQINLSQNLINEEIYEIIGGDKVALLEQVGLGTPCRFDDFANAWAQQMVSENDREKFRKIYNNASLMKAYLEGKTEIVHEFRSKLLGGNSIRILKQTILIVRDGQDGDIIALCNVKDVTRLRAEEYSSRESLMEAYKAAKHANEAKSDFLSRMSHDIRTPMNAIMGMTTIAQMHLDDKKKVDDCLRKIELASSHLLGLLNEVLDMSKIESGNFELSYDNFDIVKTMYNLVEMSRAVADKHHHQVEFDLEQVEHRVVVADSRRLEQVFTNLFGNAVKYTPDYGRIKVTLREKLSKDERYGCYEIIFEDNGIGITPEYMENIFEPFSRAEDTRINKIEGTGLGLSISKSIVAMMNGTIQVESEVNKGSKFTVTIFLKLAEGSYEEKRINDRKTGNNNLYERNKGLYSGKNVLLVEDNERNAEVASELIGITGANVETADNGKAAVDKFASGEPGYYGIIFMDIQMPVMNGYDATKNIRKLERADAGTVPIIAMTANAFMEDVEAAQTAGMNEHIAKPLEFDKLTGILKKWLG